METRESKKRGRTSAKSSKPPTKPIRRSDRIPRQPRKSGPKPPQHVDLSCEEDSPPAKIRKGALKPRKIIESSSPSDEESSAPDDAAPAGKSKEKAQGEQAEDTGEDQLADADLDEEEVFLKDVVSRLKRAQIRQGKKPVTATEEATAPPTSASEKEDSSGADSMFGDSDLEAEKAASNLLYDAEAGKRWKSYKESNCYSERRLDKVTFSEYNMVNFLKSRGLLVSLTDVEPYVKRTVQYVYANLPESFGNPLSNKYGKVFCRGKVYTINPGTINDLLGLPDEDSEDVTDLDKVASVITGEKLKKWPQPMKASSLTYMHSVLHKVMTFNWVVSSNATVVTQQHGILLYCIGLNKQFNLGKIIFDQIAAIAVKPQQATLPFPSLIYRLLKSQGFQEDAKGRQQETIPTYTINSILFSGNKARDLPWVDPNEPAQPDDVEGGVPVTVSTTILRSLLHRVEDMEQTSWRIHSEIMYSLAGLKTDLKTILSSQKGGVAGEGGSGDKEDEQAADGSNQGTTETGV